MLRHYDDQVSWRAYQQSVLTSQAQMGMYNEDFDEENFYPAIVLKVADPNGAPWNTNQVQLYPNEGEIDTNVDNYRSIEKNNVAGVTKNGLEFSIIYSVKVETKTESIINVARTIWVIIVLTIAAMHFSGLTNKLVLYPLERMLETVKKIAKDPASAADADDMNNAGIYSYMKKKNEDEKKQD